jgi:hypothetical protein
MQSGAENNQRCRLARDVSTDGLLRMEASEDLSSISIFAKE